MIRSDMAHDQPVIGLRRPILEQDARARKQWGLVRTHKPVAKVGVEGVRVLATIVPDVRRDAKNEIGHCSGPSSYPFTSSGGGTGNLANLQISIRS